MDSITLLHEGLRTLHEAAALELAGRAGICGIITPHAQEAMKAKAQTVRAAFRSLVQAGLVHPPSKDTKQGSPLRYVISPKGLEVLQRKTPIHLPAQQVGMGI